MNKAIMGALLLATTLLTATASSAAVVMCTDPVTGKKTFTDKACPTAGSGKKVKIDPTNFGQGSRSAATEGAWKSDRDDTVSGRDNLGGKPGKPQTQYQSGYLPTES